MKNKRTEKQMLSYHKAVCENLFSMMTVLQGQAENIFNFFHHYTVMSDEVNKVMNRRIDEYKKGIDDLKKAMNDGCARVEEFYDKNSIPLFHEHKEKYFRTYLDRAKGMPPDLKKAMEELTAKYKSGCNSFKKFVDKNTS